MTGATGGGRSVTAHRARGAPTDEQKMQTFNDLNAILCVFQLCGECARLHRHRHQAELLFFWFGGLFLWPLLSLTSHTAM